MTIKLTILMDNNRRETAGSPSLDTPWEGAIPPRLSPAPGAPPAAGAFLATEHGFSLWIEHPAAGNILFDTGQSEAFAANAAQLGVSLETATAIVLSHGHYDHTGGLKRALAAAPAADLYAHPGVAVERYSHKTGRPRAIGMPEESRQALTEHPETLLHWVDEPLCLPEGVGLTGPVPRVTPFEDTGGKFSLDPAGEERDLIADDLSLWIETPKGLIICFGCCHAGLVNTLDTIIAVTGESRIRGLVGGLHLLNADEERLVGTCTRLGSLNLDFIAPCHCTGERAAHDLASQLDCRVALAYAGWSMQV